MFHVDYDRTANVLNISVKGFFNPEDVAWLAAELGDRAREAQAISPDFNVIVESLEFPVQANNVADLLADIARAGMPMTGGRAAIVVGSHLNKVQAERTLAHPRLQVFLAMDDARRWLADGGPVETAAAIGATASQEAILATARGTAIE